MKAIVKSKAETGLWMEEVEKPSPGPGEVLIKIRKAAICGTDVHIYKWDEWSQKTVGIPTILGHEFVGEVAELGDGVTEFTVGQRVSAEGHITCGHCENCMIGQRYLCSNCIGTGSQRDGGFADFVAMPRENIFPIPDAVPDNIAAILDPCGNSVHTALSADLVGKDVLITGAGPVGLMAVPIVRFAGARHVVVTDVNDYRLGLARKMGNCQTVDVRSESLKDVCAELGLSEGFSVGLEMSGNVQAFDGMLEVLRPGSHAVLLGLLPNGAGINWNHVIFKALTVQGIYGRKIFETWFQMTRMIESGLDISPVITHEFEAEDFQKGFDAMLSGQCGKVILNWSS